MSNELVLHTPTQEEWGILVQQSDIIAKSGLAPQALRNNPNAILTIAMKGRELGLPPMVALNEVHIIQGRPTLSANLMRALVARAGHRIWIDPNSDEKRATVKGVRYNRIDRCYEDFIAEASFTMEEGKQAGLTNKDNWKKYPKAMLVARATAILVREHFADVVMGVAYTPDEIDPEVELDEDGLPVVKSYAAKQAPDFDALPSGAGSGTPTPTPTPAAGTAEPSAPAPTKAQLAKAHAILGENAIDEELYRAAMRRLYDVSSFKDLSKGQLVKLIDRLETKDGIDKFSQAGMEQLEDEMVETANIPNGVGEEE